MFDTKRVSQIFEVALRLECPFQVLRGGESSIAEVGTSKQPNKRATHSSPATFPSDTFFRSICSICSLIRRREVVFEFGFWASHSVPPAPLCTAKEIWAHGTIFHRDQLDIDGQRIIRHLPVCLGVQLFSDIMYGRGNRSRKRVSGRSQRATISMCRV